MRLLGALGMVALAGFGLALGSSQGQPGPRAEPEPPNLLQEGIQVEARGPVHEAFAQPTVLDPEPAPVVPQKPPQVIEELPPETKPEGAVWIPGYWGWDDDADEFLWVSGLWRLPPPERSWVAGYWREVQGGWQRVSGYWALASQQVVEAWPEPPAPIPEAVPQPPQVDAIHVPGCWVFVETHYLWRPGFWVSPRPGWVYRYPTYVWTPAGCIFVDGHWDHDFHHCGVLFSPVRIDLRVIRPGWVYRPHYCVPVDFFVRALFVRRDWCHYFFGDFYDVRYARRGYHPWIDYRSGGRTHDPYFTYYRWRNRDSRWDDDLRATYVGRREGKMALPPRTLAQQQKTDVKVAVSIKQIASVQNIKLENVSKTQSQEMRQSANQLRAFAVKRGTMEVQGKSALGGSVKGGGTAVKLDLPLPKLAAKAPESVKPPPPPPSVPKPTPRPIEQKEPTKGKDDKPSKLDPGKPPLPPKGKDDKPSKLDPAKPPLPPPVKGKDDKPPKADSPKPLPPPKKDDKPPKADPPPKPLPPPPPKKDDKPPKADLPKPPPPPLPKKDDKPPKADPPKVPPSPPPKIKDDRPKVEPPPKPPKVDPSKPKPPPPPPPKDKKDQAPPDKSKKKDDKKPPADVAPDTTVSARPISAIVEKWLSARTKNWVESF